MTAIGTIVAIPWKGLVCREQTCLHPVTMIHTPKGRQMPLEADRIAWHPGDDERGLFVVVRPFAFLAPPVALSLAAARDQGFDLDQATPIYRSHFAGCTAAARFRRRPA